MRIECPKCFKENKLNLEAKVICGHCKEVISGYSYRKPLISATTALFIGAGGFYTAEKLLEDRRYPILEEYGIVESCVSSYSKLLSASQFKNKRAICICALDRTQDDFSVSDFRKYEREFLAKFEENAKQCK